MEKVVLIGLGAVGLTYAVRLEPKCDLYILADEVRVNRYRENKPVFNGVEREFNYILPDDKFDADLIIIATKHQGLEESVKSIKNFVSEKTRIISLINGISSEERIIEAYPQARVLKSYFIGHSAVREGNSVTQDGIGEIVVERDGFIEKFFEKTGINYSVPLDIDYSMWLKYTFNIFSNQVSAVLDMNFGELKRSGNFREFAKKVVLEVKAVAEKKGVKNLDRLEVDALDLLDRMCDEGKTSMHQDILAKRTTEVELFAGEVIAMGRRFGLSTPYNQVLYDLIKIKEEDNEYSIHSRKSGE